MYHLLEEALEGVSQSAFLTGEMFALTYLTSETPG